MENLQKLIIDLEAIRDIRNEFELYIKHEMKNIRKTDKSLTDEERRNIVLKRVKFSDMFSRLMNLYGILGENLDFYIKELYKIKCP